MKGARVESPRNVHTPERTAGSLDGGILFRMQDLVLGYGGKTILAGVTLSARRGACLGILGPNGSGKTTLLRALLGGLRPLSGRIEWGFQCNGGLRIGYVPQKERLDPAYPVTVEEVVRMGTFADRPRRLFAGPAQQQRVDDALGRVRMHDRRRLLFADCSGGQRQRTLIARALATEPDVLILDEPTTGIDPAAQAQVTALLQELRAERRMTLLIVTQHFGHVERLFEYVAWVHGGTVQMGPAAEFLTDEHISRVFGRG